MSNVSFDISTLEKFAMGIDEIKEFIEEFILQSAQDIENLKNFYQSNNQDGIRQLVHRMKNITLLLNIQPVLSYIQQLESINNNDPAFYDLVNSLIEDLNRVIKELRKSILDNIS